MAKTKDGEQTFAFKREDLKLPTLVKNVPALVVVEGASIGFEVRLDKPVMVIGRDELAEIPVDDRLVSREHARIEARGDPDASTYFLIDNGSTNGTFLNNRQAQEAELHEGDKIRVGRTILRFSYHDQIDAEYHRRIFDLITYDDLTGLLTLRPFYRELERELQRAQRLELPVAVLMMDLDFFKRVNDTHGHQAGSQVLKECGYLIRQALRYQDSAARYGGEEFIAYMPGADSETARAGAERVRQVFDEHTFEHRGQAIRVTISIGVAGFPDDGSDVNDLVRRADERLYRAKKQGRNRVV